MNNDEMRDDMHDAIEEAVDEVLPRPRRHVWVVQLIEYTIGFAIAWTAARAQEPLIPALVAAAVIANAAIVKAPLSAFRVTSPRVHRALGIFLSVGALVLAIFLDVDAGTKALLVISAVAEGFVSVRFGHGI